MLILSKRNANTQWKEDIWKASKQKKKRKINISNDRIQNVLEKKTESRVENSYVAIQDRKIRMKKI